MARKRKPMKKLTNFDRLKTARVLEERHFTDKEKKAVNRMSRQEVDFMIRMRKKRGSAPANRCEIRPNFFL